VCVLRGEDASASDTVQHIALGREIEGHWCTLFRSDAIDQLVKQAVELNRSAQRLVPGERTVGTGLDKLSLVICNICHDRSYRYKG
jgi:hypothetical protein